MSDQETKEKHSRRIHQKESHMIHNRNIAALFLPKDSDVLKTPHKFAEKSPISCGNKKCILCMNPRKMGNKTVQEMKFPSDKEWMNEELQSN